MKIALINASEIAAVGANRCSHTERQGIDRLIANYARTWGDRDRCYPRRFMLFRPRLLHPCSHLVSAESPQ